MYFLNLKSGGVEGYLHLKITDTINNTVMYDSLALVSVSSGFKDTVNLDSGVYKCEILQQDIDVDLPKLALSTGEYPPMIDNYFIFSYPANSFIHSNDSIKIKINTVIFSGDSDEWIHLRISETITGKVWYERTVAVTVLNGFKDLIYLDSGIYKCEILDMGANVAMPTIILDNGTNAVWGYPDYEYYLFSLPSVVSSVHTNLLKFNVSIYPNPIDEKVTIKSELIINSYRIIDISGKTIKAKNNLNDKQVTIDFDKVNIGIYFIQYQIDNTVYTEKVIKN